MDFDADFIGYCIACVGAVVLMLWLRPRWDTGGGALMIFALGVIGAPIWAVLLALVCLYILIRGAAVIAFYIFVAPIIWLYRHRTARRARRKAMTKAERAAEKEMRRIRYAEAVARKQALTK